MDKLIQKRDDIKLKLSNNRITEIKGLETLTNLQYLSLYDNQITEIKGLDTLVNLQELSLTNNQITEIKGLKTLANLQILSLTHNLITEIKELETLVNLRELWIYNNKIIEVKGLKTLVNLQKLHLDHNQITTNINYLCIPDSLIWPSNLIKGKKICLKAKLLLDKIMIVNTVKWWYVNHHLQKPRHPFCIRYHKKIVAEHNKKLNI